MLFRSNDTATTEIYTPFDTLSLHDALPISRSTPSMICRALKAAATTERRVTSVSASVQPKPIDLAGELNFATVADYVALLKPRVMSLVLFTGIAGLVLAPGTIHIATALTALLAIAVGAGASGALNMAYDADIDRLMARTRSRDRKSTRLNSSHRTVPRMPSSA